MSLRDISYLGPQTNKGIAVKSLALAALFTVSLICTQGVARAQLPPEVQADLLQADIISDIKNKDFKSAKQNIAKYRALKLEMPPAVIIIDAKVAMALNDPIRAKKVLEEYFKKAGKSDSSYKGALQLYRNVKEKAAEAKSRAAAQRAAQYAKQKPIRIQNACWHEIKVLINTFDVRDLKYKTSGWVIVPPDKATFVKHGRVENGSDLYYYAETDLKALVWQNTKTPKTISHNGKSFNFITEKVSLSTNDNFYNLRLRCNTGKTKTLRAYNYCSFPARMFVHFYNTKTKKWTTTDWVTIRPTSEVEIQTGSALQVPGLYYTYAESFDRKYQWGSRKAPKRPSHSTDRNTI